MDVGFDLERALKGKRKGGRLENWFVHEFVNYLEVPMSIALGEIIGDPRFPASAPLKTSPVLAVHEKECILETRNTYYELGNPADEEAKTALKAILGYL